MAARHTHLQLRGETYFYRRSVPAAIRDLVGCSAIVRTLRTSDLRVARERSRRLDAEVEGLFQAASAGVVTKQGAADVERSRQLVEDLCRLFERDTVEADRAERIRLRDTEAGEFGLDRGDAVTLLRESHENGRLPVAEAIATLQKHGVQLSAEVMTDLFYALQPAELRARRLIEADRDAAYEGRPQVELPGDRAAQTNLENRLEAVKATLTLGEAAELYKADKIATGQWSQKTAADTGAHLDRFVVSVGSERELQSVTREDIRAWRDGLRLSTGTKRVRVQMVSALLNWCEREGHVERNAASGLAPREPSRRSGDARKAYSSADLRLLFGEDLTAVRDSRPDRFWVPLLALYTGARVAELCQLAIADVERKDGHLCLQIRARLEGQRLKNEASERIVPVHPHLTAIGFGDYVKTRRREAGKDPWLFTDCTPSQSGRTRGSAMSTWWSWRSKRIDGLTPNTALHSLRHGFVQSLIAAGVAEVVVKQLAGHGDSSITTGTYGRRLDVEQLAQGVAVLDFSQVVHALRTSSQEG